MAHQHLQRVPRVGIVAGTAEGAALCYRTLCQEAQRVMGRNMHPKITLHAFPLRNYLEAIDRDDWTMVAQLLSRSVDILVAAGADFVICPNNTLHEAFDLVKTPVPWRHIAKPVALEATHRGWRRVGLLGTQLVMEGGVYTRSLQTSNIDVVIPDRDDRLRIQHIIRTELIAGLFMNKSRAFLQKVIAGMAAQGAEAVILGCTELPLLISEDQSVLPLLDSTRLQAQDAVSYMAALCKAKSEMAFLDRSLSLIQ
jgi:aspartate racemase